MGCLGEIQDAAGNRVQSNSTPPAWHWLEEKYVPVTTDDLSPDARNLSDSATLRGLPDSQDPTYQDCWPSERYPSDGPEDSTPESAWAGYVERFHAGQVGATVKEPVTVDQCECCRAAPGRPHAIGCEAFEERLTYTPQIAKSQIDAVETHTGPEDTSETEPKDFGGYESLLAAARPFLGAPYVWSCSDYGAVTDTDSILQEQAIFPLVESSGDVKVESCSECGQSEDGMGFDSCDFCGRTIDARDPDYGPDPGGFPERETPPAEETPSVPFPVQSWVFEALIETEIDNLHALIDDHHDEILEMARKRHREGFVTHGSEMYSWSPERRLDETLQELADAGVYPTSGPIE